jgi:hypothetical protein
LKAIERILLFVPVMPNAVPESQPFTPNDVNGCIVIVTATACVGHESIPHPRQANRETRTNRRQCLLITIFMTWFLAKEMEHSYVTALAALYAFILAWQRSRNEM